MRRRNDARAAMASSASLPSLHALSTEAATTGMHWDDDMRDRWAPVRQRTWHNDAVELEHEIARMREEEERKVCCRPLTLLLLLLLNYLKTISSRANRLPEFLQIRSRLDARPRLPTVQRNLMTICLRVV